jgi:hypothetical protein
MSGTPKSMCNESAPWLSRSAISLIATRAARTAARNDDQTVDAPVKRLLLEDGRSLGTPEALFKLNLSTLFYGTRDYCPTRNGKNFYVFSPSRMPGQAGPRSSST